MGREKILLNFRDYNNELEKILEKKTFSESTKNLLLSMLYKIETAYPDYTIVKQDIIVKNDYLEMMLLTVLQNCSVIHLVKPGTEKAKALDESKKQTIVDNEKNEILAYQNEISLLYGILELGLHDLSFDVKESILKEPLSDFFACGKMQELLEVLKDFNGWSWNISKDEPNGYDARICYLNLVQLLGIQAVMDLEKKKDVVGTMLEQLTLLYGEKNAKEFLSLFLKMILKIYARKNETFRNTLVKKINDWNKKAQEIQDKKRYLEKLTQKKIKINKQIGQIDLILNNNELLRKNFREANSKLPMEKKHFSMSTYAETLEKKRKSLMEERTEINYLLEPENFMKTRDEIFEKANFFIGMEDLDEKQTMQSLQVSFLTNFQKKIGTAIEKKEVIEMFYRLRYYLIQIQDRNQIQVPEERIRTLKWELIKKAMELKVCNNLVKDKVWNFRVLCLLFNTKIINLEKTSAQIETKGQKTQVKIFDEKIQEEIIQLEEGFIPPKEIISKKRKKIFE